MKMGLFDFIKGKANGSKDSVDQLALLGADESRTKEFLELLSKSDVWVVGEVDQLNTERPDQNSILRHIEEGAQGVAEVRTIDEVRVHTFKLGDYSVVPFFTSQECIQDYTGSLRIERVTRFPCFQCSASILLRDDLLRTPAVMNPKSKLTRYFSAEDKTALAKLLLAKSQT